MSTEIGVTLTSICWVVLLLAALVVAVPQAILSFKLRRSYDGLGLYRLKSMLIYGAGALTAARTAGVFADYVWFDQTLFGPLSERWPVDLLVAFVAMIAYVFAAGLYLREHRRRA